MARQGDSIICAIEYGKLANGKVPVIFTLNGEMIYKASMRYEKGKKELYPFIGMGHAGIRVLAKVRDLFEYIVPSKTPTLLALSMYLTEAVELGVCIRQV